MAALAMTDYHLLLSRSHFVVSLLLWELLQGLIRVSDVSLSLSEGDRLIYEAQ